MNRPIPTRKQRFAAAVALRGITQGEWAEQQEVHPAHLSQVLTGKRVSVRLFRKIDAFIADVLGEIEAAQAA